MSKGPEGNNPKDLIKKRCRKCFLRIAQAGGFGKEKFSEESVTVTGLPITVVIRLADGLELGDAVSDGMEASKSKYNHRIAVMAPVEVFQMVELR